VDNQLLIENKWLISARKDPLRINSVREPDKLNFICLERIASTSGKGGTTKGRISVDFTINGESLLRLLVAVDGSNGDFMGCFVQGYEEENRKIGRLLLGASLVDAQDDERILLYICPECGDIGCGSFAVKVYVHASEVVWSDFSYLNGYEPASPVAGIGPFRFLRIDYAAVVARASVF